MLAPHIREAIVEAPLVSNNIWNIDALQSKLKLKTQHQQFFPAHPRFGWGVDYLEDKEAEVSQGKRTKEVIVSEVDSKARDSRDSIITVKVRNNIDQWWNRLDNRFVESIIMWGLKIFFINKKTTLSKFVKNIEERQLTLKQK